MKIRLENPALMLSKAAYGRFDVMLMSREAAEAYDALSLKEAGSPVLILSIS